MRSTRSYHRRTRRFETLENRMMMAGNVTASLSGGCLQLCGDTKNNIIAVKQLSSGDWCVVGLLGTKICGQKSATFCNVCSICAKLDCGNDVVAFINGCLPGDLCVDTSKGNDAVALLHLTAGKRLRHHRRRQRPVGGSRRYDVSNFHAPQRYHQHVFAKLFDSPF